MADGHAGGGGGVRRGPGARRVALNDQQVRPHAGDRGVDGGGDGGGQIVDRLAGHHHAEIVVGSDAEAAERRVEQRAMLAGRDEAVVDARPRRAPPARAARA